MSYWISISGHAETDNAEHARAFELEQSAIARQSLQRMHGVASATFSGGHIGSVDLLKPPVQQQPAPEPEPAAPTAATSPMPAETPVAPEPASPAADTT